MFFGFFMMNSFKMFGSHYINDDKFLTFIGSFGALFNGCLRIVWSALLDYYPFRNVFSGLIAIQILVILTISWSVNNKWTYLLSVSMSNMCEGAISAVMPTLTLHVFGTKRGN